MSDGARHVLFVCGRAQWRSPTAERVFGRDPRYSCRARGVSASAARRLTAGDLAWADVVIVMEREHAARLRDQHRDALGALTLHVLEIPDDYGFMDPELVTLLEERVPELLDD